MKRLPIFLDLVGLPEKRARDLVAEFDSRVGGFKVPQGFEDDEHLPWWYGDVCSDLWVDQKFNDEPETVSRLTRNYYAAGATIISVHASGGVEMMKVAAGVAPNLKVLAITVLPSLSNDEVFEIYGGSRQLVTYRLAKLAKRAGVWGVVCSPLDLKFLHEPTRGLDGLKLVAAGIKPLGSPAEVFQAGADFLVLGNEVTGAAEPGAAFAAIEADIRPVLEERGQ